MFNISSYQRYANQNYSEISPHTGQNGYHKKSTNKKCQKRMWREGNLPNTWWECKSVLWRTIQKFLRKIKIELPYEPAVQLLGIYLEKNMIRKNTCTPVFIAALLTIAKTWKQPKCPLTVKQIKKISLMILLICRTLERIQMNLQNRNSLTDTENKLMAPKGKGRRGNKSGVRHCLIHTTVFKAARGIVCNIL